MKSGRQIGYVFLATGVFMALMLAPSSSSGQVFSDQTVGPSSAPLNEGVIVMPPEALPKELDQRFERFLQAPEISSETADHRVIGIPDQPDFENARDSALRSSWSY